jgi:hypothetical protein
LRVLLRDLMVASVERRFGGTRTTRVVEWLSDNGSAHRAKDTLDMATALGLRLAFTPPRSPESNGIAEAFVKTLKRDYAKVTLLPDAPTILRLAASWIEDRNTSHPHSGCSRPKSSAPAVPNPTSPLSGQTGRTPPHKRSTPAMSHLRQESANVTREPQGISGAGWRYGAARDESAGRAQRTGLGACP